MHKSTHITIFVYMHICIIQSVDMELRASHINITFFRFPQTSGFRDLGFPPRQYSIHLQIDRWAVLSPGVPAVAMGSGTILNY